MSPFITIVGAVVPGAGWATVISAIASAIPQGPIWHCYILEWPFSVHPDMQFARAHINNFKLKQEAGNSPRVQNAANVAFNLVEVVKVFHL